LEIKMKRLTIILLMIGMLSLVSAGIIASTWEKDFTLDKTKLDKIKTVSNLPEINIEVGDIICDDEECWATIYQKDLIQETFRMNKDYCTEWNYTQMNDTQTGGECLSYDEPVCNNYTEVIIENNLTHEECMDYDEPVCNNYNEIIITKGALIKEECIAWEDYTLDEIKTEIQSYIEKRITDWSDVEDERQKNVKDKKSEKGKIKEKK